jgi:ADP-heptose:LPS heptosyltransferase
LSTQSSAPARIVLARPDRIGDVVITSSCFEPVRRALPGVELHFVAQARMEPLFHGHPALTSFIGLSAHHDRLRRMESLAAQLRQLQPQCIVHLHSDPEVEWAAAAAEIPRRIGFRLHGHKYLTESLPYEKKRGKKHEGHYNFDLLKLLDVSAPPTLHPSLTPEKAGQDRLAGKLPAGLVGQRYAVLHVGAHGDKPRIAPEFFIAAARWLVNEAHCYVVFTGAERDDPHLNEILGGMGRAVSWSHNLGGQTDLAETAWLLRDAAVVFGRDSGPAHLAAAMGVRTVTLMLEPEAENSSQRWKPLGAQSWVLEKPMARGWLESRPGFARRNQSQFTADEIIAALKLALEA